MKKVAVLLVLFFSAFATGCATLADAEAAKGTGQYRIYNKNFDIVWNTAIDAVKHSDLVLVSQDKAQRIILAQRGMTAFSYGEDVAIFVDPVKDAVKTRVEVVSKRALSVNLTAANWEGSLLNYMDSKLN